MDKFYRWFRRLFKGEKDQPEENNSDPINPKNTMIVGNELSTITGIEWIDNDGLLRDEGVLFGIAKADREEKLTAIRYGFDNAKAKYVVKRKQLVESLNEVNAQMEEVVQSIGQAKIEILELKLNKITSDTKVLPTFVQFLIYAIISYLNYFLLSFWLKPVFGDNYLIPLGIYSFGMLSVFIGKALVYNSNASVQQGDDQSNKRERWKIWMEEFGVPLVVAAFIILISVRVYPAEWSVGGFILFFFLFSFAGKGLINSLYRCHYEFRLLKIYLGKVISKTKELRLKKTKIKKDEAKGKDLKGFEDKIRGEITEPETKLSQLDALLAYKINIFESEYMLASNAAADFSSKQKASFQI